MSNSNLDGKKKKLIVAIVLAVIVVTAVVSVVFAVNGKNGKYVDTPVSDMNNTSQITSEETENNNLQNPNTTKQTTEKPTEETTKPTTEKTTKKPKSRYAYITVQLPIGNSSADTLEILIDGKVVAKEDVKVDGSSVTIATEEKYKGDIEVEARLVKYDTSASAKILAGDNSKTLVIPLNGLEEGFGKDE